MVNFRAFLTVKLGEVRKCPIAGLKCHVNSAAAKDTLVAQCA